MLEPKLETSGRRNGDDDNDNDTGRDDDGGDGREYKGRAEPDDF